MEEAQGEYKAQRNLNMKRDKRMSLWLIEQTLRKGDFKRAHLGGTKSAKTRLEFKERCILGALLYTGKQMAI